MVKTPPLKTTRRAAPPQTSPSDRLTAQQCADGMGVKLNTFWSYVSRSQFAGPDGHDDFSGKPFWYRKTYETALARRPGAGARTDLTPAAKVTTRKAAPAKAAAAPTRSRARKVA